MLEKRPEPLEGEVLSPLERAWLEIQGWLRFKDAVRESRERSESTLGSQVLQLVIAIVVIGVPLAMIVIAVARLVF